MKPLYHRLEVYVVDFENYGIEDIIASVENIDHLTVAEHQTTTIPNWSDKHELNKRTCTIKNRRKYFNIGEVGQYVDIPERPKTELEIENETLKKENQNLKDKLLRIKNAVDREFT